MATDARRRTRGRLRTTVSAVVLLLLALLTGVTAQAAPRIGIATMQPGEIFFERFGHNAVVVDDGTGQPISYNYGYFDPDEPDFIANFVHGVMMYRLVALPWREDLQQYVDSGRGVSVQWLDLDDAQATAVADALADNARPEHARYRYEYFTDNCATRVRDVVDRALGGALKPQLTVRSQGNTYRSEAVRLASPATWMWLGFDVGLGPSSDQPMSRWEEAYVPMRLAASLREAKRADGRPLVLREERLTPQRIAPEPPESERVWRHWLLVGLAMAACWRWLRLRRPRTAGALALVFWLVSGLLGALMLFLWLDTDHRFAWANHNLLLASPFALLLLPGAWAWLRGRTPGRFFRGMLSVVGVLAIGAVLLHWMSPQPQANAHWIALLLPLHAAFVLTGLLAPADAERA